MKKVLCIVNPVSGRMKIRTALVDVLDQFEKAGYQTQVVITQRSGYAAEILARCDSDTELVVCCGGDGTLSEVASALHKRGLSIPCGYIPSGSTNDFANCIGLLQEPTAAAQAIVAGHPETFDLGKFNQQYFIYIASFGAFSSASYSVPQSTKNALGHFAYVLGGIKDVKNIVPIQTAYEVDGVRREGEYVFGAVMNSTSIAGIVKLDSRLVNMNDGEFEVILVKMPQSLADLQKIIHSITTSDFDNPMFEFFKTKEIQFDFEKEIPWSLDGEYCNGGERVRIQNVKDGIVIVK